MDYVIFLVLIVVGATINLIYNAVKKSTKKKEMSHHLATMNYFTSTQEVIGSDGMSGLSVDEQRKKICLIDHSTPDVITRIISYRDILSCEISEDGVEMTKTSRTSQLGGALVGGLALGGVGMIVGGLSGKKVTAGKVTRVDLRITVNDTKQPIHIINFLSNVAFDKRSGAYHAVIEKAKWWYAIIEVLIKQADIEDKKAEAKEMNTTKPTPSIATELKLLSELRTSGVLSDQEFQEQKKKLLS